MAEILTFDPIEDCVRDVISTLEKEDFEEVVWVGMHGWIRWIARGIWLQGHRFEKILTNTDSRWGQEYEDIDAHKLTCVSFEAVKEIGDRAVYVIGNTHGEKLTAQLVALGCSSRRVFVLPERQYYMKNAKKRMMECYGSKMELMPHKEIQAALLNLLCEFKKVCGENGLSYFLDSGTLLGAVRHQGFIPWDNDMDVAMPIEDYKKLKALFPAGGRYELIDCLNYPGLGRWYPMFVDNNFHVYSPSSGNVVPLNIDIFPLTGGGNSWGEAFENKRKLRAAAEKFHIYFHTRAFDKVNRLPELMETILKSNPNSQWLLRSYYANTIYKREWYEDFVQMKFEGIDFPVPCGYEEVLFIFYGTYTELPVIENRSGFKMEYFREIEEG